MSREQLVREMGETLQGYARIASGGADCRDAGTGVQAYRAMGSKRSHALDPGINMKAVWKDTVIAESPDTVIVEGNHYFPLESVNTALLEPSSHTSVCPWKGTANYYSLNVNSERNLNAVWYYAEPKDEAAQIKGRVAFWKGVSVIA